MSEELVVEVSRVYESSPERVFDAWLDPAALARFMMPAPGVQVEDVSVDPKPGGDFGLVMMAGATRIPIRGSYLAVERATLLEFSWLSSRTRNDSVVRLEFEALDERRTRLTLRHTGFPDASSRDDHDGGWSHILESMVPLLKTRVSSK